MDFASSDIEQHKTIVNFFPNPTRCITHSDPWGVSFLFFICSNLSILLITPVNPHDILTYYIILEACRNECHIQIKTVLVVRVTNRTGSIPQCGNQAPRM